MGEEQDVSAAFKWSLLGGMILSGAANTVMYKAQNSSILDIVNPYGVTLPYQFNHPYMQAMVMFLGEFICFSMYIFTKKMTSKQREAQQEEYADIEAEGKLSTSKIKYVWLAIPACSDFCTSTLQYIALNYINPSIYQMLRGGVIIITAVFSKVFLKRTIHLYMIIGCCLVFVGIGMVGTSGFVKNPLLEGGSDDGQGGSAQAIAMILIVISLLFNGCQFVSEEFLFGKFHLDQFQVVGTEGFWGLIVYSMVLPILSTVSCPLNKLGFATCVVYPKYNDDKNDHMNQHNSHFENPSLYFTEFGMSGNLATLCILGVVTIAIFNVCGVSVTKHINALTRSIADVSRTVLVWIVSILVTKYVGEDHKNKTGQINYIWENLTATAVCIEAAGFVILVVGNFVYNGIIILPFAKPPSTDEYEEGDQDDIKEPMVKDVSMQDQEQTTFGKNRKRSKRNNSSFAENHV